MFFGGERETPMALYKAPRNLINLICEVSLQARL